VSKEKAFFSALRDLFVGAKVEGESGFVNLMRMKSRYYEEGVFPRLRGDIERALAPFPEFREELFDRLYTFFRRYFSESGSIYFRFTPPHGHVYERVYTDDRDVVLFWKTHMLYYVKTDCLFRSMTAEVDGFRFFFDVSALEHRRANEKRDLIYTFRERRGDGTLVFTVVYTERGRQTNLEEIRRAIRDAQGLKRFTPDIPSEETLERAFRLFERQSEVDFFINKDARRFLQEQFDLWLYQYVFEPGQRDGTVWTEARVRQLRALKDIAYRIIDLIAQFEDELVRIWNKPKFVRGSHYLITLDRIAGQEGGTEVLERIFAHPGIEDQVQEWRELGMVGEDWTPEAIWSEDLVGRRLHERYRYLPLDTRYFPDLEPAILALFDHLDQELDGWLVHSENYQALNTLLPKFRGRVRCIYIDPPYNTATTEIPYPNRFRHAAYASMMENRLALARELLSEDGVLFVSIDKRERAVVEGILVRLLGEENRVEEVIWVMNTTNSQVPTYSTNHEYVEVWAKDLERVKADPMTFREPKPGYPEVMALIEALNSRYPPIAEVERALEELYRRHREEWLREAAAQGMSREEAERNDPWRGLYPYRRAEYRDAEGRYVPEAEAQARKAGIWVWQEGDMSMPAGKQSPTTRDPNHPNYRFYRPRHPVTGKPCPPPKRGWNRGYEEFLRLAEDHRIVWGEDERKVPRIKRFLHETETNVAKSVVVDYSDGEKELSALFGRSGVFFAPKPTSLVGRFVRQTARQGEIVLDFFAGSGTTAHAVIHLNREDGGRRKYILVEVADHFHTVLLPRIKKAIFSDRWKDGKAREDGRGVRHFVKYFRLEQYEEVLRKACFRDDAPLFFRADPYTQYVFLRDPKMLDNAETGERVMEVDLEGDRIRVDLSKLYPDIDLVETLSCLTGRWIRRIHPAADDPTRPGAVEFEDGTVVNAQDPPWEMIRPLIWW
jgi:hypothetical protein